MTTKFELNCEDCGVSLMDGDNIDFENLRSVMPNISCNWLRHLCPKCYVIDGKRVELVKQQVRAELQALEKEHDFVEVNYESFEV